VCRYQPEKRGDACLATIEAIYFFYRDFIERQQGSYNGEADNLLLFFSHQYKLIQNVYQKEQKRFNRIPNYIQPTEQQDQSEAAEAE